MTTRKLYLALLILQSVMKAWTLTTYTLFVLSYGLTFTELGILNSTFMGISFLIDPWTGWLGDRFGHKKAYTVGVVLNALAMLIYGFSQNFGGMLLAEIIAGFGYAFMSEAPEAWLENSVGHDEATQIISLADSRTKLAGILSAVLGAAVGSVSLSLPWILSALSSLPILYLLWKYPWQGNLEKATTQDQAAVSYSFKEAKLVWQNAYLRNAVAISAFVAFLAQPLNMFWNAKFQPEIGQFGLGILWAVVAIAMALGSRFAGRFSQVSNRILGIALMIIAVAVFLASSEMALVALVGFVLHEAPRGFLGPAMRTYVREDTPAHLRAYFGSIRSALSMLAAAIGLMVFGPLADSFGIIVTWQLVSVAFALGGLVYILKK